ncbi:sugar transport protein 2 [Coccidioides immitis RMSCC 3703]|uniref:Sugar transport protein 2 n=1 Tax=Coccidioides immitis RMSCC 3703 TaxID=454286 RepID=A0A0J8QT54_COCIT|nr:sugar transport protein 2 [Coccidioides immitis RMSCC 3703]
MKTPISSWNVADRLKKRQLLIAINTVAALSISSSAMTRDYIDLMKFGHTETINGSPHTPVITDSLLQGGIVSVYYLGTLIGALFGGWVGDKIGRIKSIALGSVWGVIGAALQCSAQNHVWMIFARLVNGFGTGILNAIVPVWATETAEHTSRGQFIAIEFTLNIFGVVVAYWLEFGLAFIDDGVSAFRWRFPIAFQIIPLLILFAAVWFFPESPRWLVKMGHEEEARYILGRLRGDEGEDVARAEAEFQDIKHVAELERTLSYSTSYFSMFTGRTTGKLHLGRRVELVVWLQIMQEWVGIAGVTIYAPTIFRIAGFDAMKSQWISGLNNIFYMTLLCPVMFDSIGEKTLYIFAISNVITIPMVWALYPESNQRTLEDMDLLFAADTPWTWDAERTFTQLKNENPDFAQAAAQLKGGKLDEEMGKLGVQELPEKE